LISKICYNLGKGLEVYDMTAMRPDFGKLYSYADYLGWAEGERLELIDGIPYMMTPAPSRVHQEILFELGGQFRNALKGKACKGYVAPFDVRLSNSKKMNDDEIYTVVQPDLVVVCDRSKLDKRGCNGAPDLAIEIISPSTASHDYIKKMELYEKHGVTEYWIVHPIDQVVMVHSLVNGQYTKPKIYDKEAVVQVQILPEIEINLSEVFVDIEDDEML
jgi:Uma2 family endonuclease